MDRVLAGRYELEVPLGRGGSGEVWRGRDMATHRPVAIKLVELSLIDDPGTLAETIGRFRREATVISGLRHQNIVGALDAGRIGNQLFMVMELAPGISLASMMDERGARGMGLFPVTSVLRMAEQVCAGLAAAHEAGVVHRDIKPSNLMVTPQLGVKIIDFGIARLLADNSPRLTLPAQTVGTIAYISPEQAQGLDVDGRADLYSLGCVLYQLLSGRPPFFSTMPGALLMMQVMDRPAPLSAIRPDLPRRAFRAGRRPNGKGAGRRGPRPRPRSSPGSRRLSARSAMKRPSTRPTGRRSGPVTIGTAMGDTAARRGLAAAGPVHCPYPGTDAEPACAGRRGCASVGGRRPADRAARGVACAVAAGAAGRGRHRRQPRTGPTRYRNGPRSGPGPDGPAGAAWSAP